MTAPPPRVPRGRTVGRRGVRALAAGVLATTLTGLSLYGGPLPSAAALTRAADAVTVTLSRSVPRSHAPASPWW